MTDNERSLARDARRALREGPRASRGGNGPAWPKP